MTQPMTVWTIGHSTRSLEQLVNMLEDFIAIEWKQKQGLAKAEEALLLACQNNF